MPDPNAPGEKDKDEKVATANIRIREYELWFLLRARQLRKQAGGRKIRIEIELTADTLEITNVTQLNPDLVLA